MEEILGVFSLCVYDYDDHYCLWLTVYHFISCGLSTITTIYHNDSKNKYEIPILAMWQHFFFNAREFDHFYEKKAIRSIE